MLPVVHNCCSKVVIVVEVGIVDERSKKEEFPKTEPFDALFLDYNKRQKFDYFGHKSKARPSDHFDLPCNQAEYLKLEKLENFKKYFFL